MRIRVRQRVREPPLDLGSSGRSRSSTAGRTASFPRRRTRSSRRSGVFDSLTRCYARIGFLVAIWVLAGPVRAIRRLPGQQRQVSLTTRSPGSTASIPDGSNSELVKGGEARDAVGRRTARRSGTSMARRSGSRRLTEPAQLSCGTRASRVRRQTCRRSRGRPTAASLPSPAWQRQRPSSSTSSESTPTGAARHNSPRWETTAPPRGLLRHEDRLLVLPNRGHLGDERRRHRREQHHGQWTRPGVVAGRLEDRVHARRRTLDDELRRQRSEPCQLDRQGPQRRGRPQRSWSPDGRQIAFLGWITSESFNNDLIAINVDSDSTDELGCSGPTSTAA